MNDRREVPSYTGWLEAWGREHAHADKLFRYTLTTVGDKRAEPWVTAQHLMERNLWFSPLVAVNPYYQHPLSVAKRMVELSQLYSRKMALNLVSGSFHSEARALRDDIDFEGKSHRLREFAEILIMLLQTGKCRYQGRYYSLDGVEIYPKWTGPLPDLFVSGTLVGEFSPSAENLFFAKNARPMDALEKAANRRCGLGIGICARETRAEAWAAFEFLFPRDRKGELYFAIALSNQDTPWNKWLRSYIETNDPLRHDYCLRPVMNYQSAAPYLIGSYEEVRAHLSKYRELGYGFFLVDYATGDYAHVAKCLST